MAHGKTPSTARDLRHRLDRPGNLELDRPESVSDALASAGHLVSASRLDRAAIVNQSGHLLLQVSLPARTLQIPLPGSYVWSLKTKKGLQFHDLTGDGLDEIVVATSNGASLGAYVQVFRVRAGHLVLISPPADAYDIEFILSAGKPTLALYGKWTEFQLATVQALRWNGSKLAEDNQEAKRLFRLRLAAEEKSTGFHWRSQERGGK